MVTRRTPLVDSTPRLAIEGYGWLPGQRRRQRAEVVRARLMGRPTVGLCGPDAARFFYDQDNIRRHGAIPEPVRGTLVGYGAVHALDGEDHRRRKAMFTALMTPEGIATLAEYAAAEWDESVGSWTGYRPVVLFDEVSRMITRAVCRWAGVPLARTDSTAMAADLVAMIDGFGSLATRHWRARYARWRRERELRSLVEDIRRGAVTVGAGSAADAVAHFRGADGKLLDRRLAAVELLNVVRPTVAVCWLVTFAAHAMYRWPEHRDRLRDGDETYVEAFAQEVRRFYPFAPFIGGLAVRDLSWRGEAISAGSLVLLDLYGQDHDPGLWSDPYSFAPGRFLNRQPGPFDLVAQGGGDSRTGHRCPGEAITLALLRLLTTRLAGLDYEVPDQDLGISLSRVPARLTSGFILTAARPARGTTASRAVGDRRA